MPTMTYQGWKNWETWNVALWFGNDRVLYDDVRKHKGRFTAKTAKDFVLERLPSGTPDMISRDMTAGEIHDAYGRVSWTEIAHDFNEMKKG